jgi:hypothetical protein
MLFVIAVSNAQDPGTENLTHLWTFQDGTANDEVGNADGDFNGPNISVEGGDLVTVPTPENLADSWLDLPGDQIDLASYTEVSVAAWFTPDTLNQQWNSLWFFGNDGNGAGVGSDGFCFQSSRGDNKARTWISCGNETGPYSIEDAVDDTTNNPLGLNPDFTEYNDLQLHHVVCELASGGEQGIIKMYHNGVYLGEDTLGTPEGSGRENNAIFNISPNFARFAHSCYSGDYPYLGKIHEIAIYNKALTDEEVVFLFEKGMTSVENNSALLPGAFSLSQNYPNPFNPGTRISFDLPKESQVKIKVFDMLGNEIALLLDEVKPAGKHSVVFNGSNFSSGVYLYRMDIGNQVFSRKMVLLK